MMCPSCPPWTTITMAQPIVEATRPIAIVSQTGIGSGPGNAHRASRPMRNAKMIAVRTIPNMCGGYLAAR